MIRRFEAPERAGGLDELLLAQRQDLAAHDARDVGPVDDRDHHDHDREARAGSGRRSSPWRPSRPPRGRGRAAGSGRRARRRSGARGTCRSSRGRSRRPARRSSPMTTAMPVEMKRHLERHARAVDRAREDVAAEAVDAEPVLARTGRSACRRRRAPRSSARADRARRRSLTISGAKNAMKMSRTMKRERDHRDLVPAQPAPEQLHRRARGDRLRSPARCRRRRWRRRPRPG